MKYGHLDLAFQDIIYHIGLMLSDMTIGFLSDSALIIDIYCQYQSDIGLIEPISVYVVHIP